MRIINLEEFRDLPEGAIFMKYYPCVFDALSMKGKTLPSDFYSLDIAQEIKSKGSDDTHGKLLAAQRDPNISLEMDFSVFGRDGLFDKDQLFAVYEKKDVYGLINKLTECLNAYE
jgi:hypothetical protein